MCQVELRFYRGEQHQVHVPSRCPEPFRSTIVEQLEANPLVHDGPTLDLRVSFVAGRPEAVLHPLEDPGPPPRAHHRVHLPEEWVHFRRRRWPRAPSELRQPLSCSTTLDFDRSGHLEAALIRGCPPELAARTEHAVQAWRVEPRYQDVPVMIRTTVHVPFTPVQRAP